MEGSGLASPSLATMKQKYSDTICTARRGSPKSAEGEGVDRKTLQDIREVAGEVRGDQRLGYPLTTFSGPHDALLTMTVQFRRGFSCRQIELAVDETGNKIQERYTELKHIFLEVDSVRKSLPEETIDASIPPQKAVEAASVLN